MAIGKFLAPLNGQTITQQSKPYVDDIFDPLFNAQVREYYNGLYGPIGGIGAGYAEMLENALTGKQGILGPGMGILSTFGRSMDKADDFILGGLTEGVNAIGQFTRGTNETPQNPFKRIFVDDYDYQGTKLMAAAGNAMAKLAGAQTPLDETDFQSLGDKVAGTTIDLATDPGIMGGQLARLNKGTPVGQAGQILSNYDDYMANIAGNMAFPGGKALLHKNLSKIKNFLSGADSSPYQDMVTKHDAPMTITVDPRTGIASTTNLTPETLSELRKMSDTYTTDINPIDNPELYSVKEDIEALTNNVDITAYNKSKAEYDKSTLEALAKKDEAVKHLKETAQAERDKIQSTSIEGMNKHEIDFQQGKQQSTDYNPKIVIKDPSKGYMAINLSDTSEQQLLDYVKDNFKTKDVDYYGNPLEYGDFYEKVRHQVIDEHNLEMAQTMVAQKLNPNYKKFVKNNIYFIPNRKGFQSTMAKDTLDIVDYYFTQYLHKHPEGFYSTYLSKELGLKKKDWLPNNVFEDLVKYSKGKFTDGVDKISGEEFMSGNKLNNLLDAIYKRDIDLTNAPIDDLGYIDKVTETFSNYKTSLIPWIRKNTDTLNKTQVGRDLIALADGLEKDIFDNNLYEIAKKSISIQDVEQYNDEVSKTFYNTIPGISMPNKVTYEDVFSTHKFLNSNLSKEKFTPEDLKQYAEDFPYMDLAVSQDYIKKSPQYQDMVNKKQPILNNIYKERNLRNKISNLRDEIEFASLSNDSNYNFIEKSQELSKYTQEYKKLNPNLKPEDWIKQQQQTLKGITRGKTDLEVMLDTYYTPAKKQFWEKTTGKKYAYEYTAITPTNIYDATKKILTAPKKSDFIIASESLATFTPETFTKTITSNSSFQDAISTDLYTKTFSNFKNAWGLPPDMPSEELSEYVRKYGDRTEKTLFQQISAARTTKLNNRLQTTDGALNVEIVKTSKRHADALEDSKMYTDAQKAEYISRKDLAEGVKISGDNFLESIWASNGFKEFPIPANMKKAQADEIAKALQQNVNIVNKNGNILKFIDVTGEDKVRRLAIAFDVDNLSIKKDINKIYGFFGKKNLGLQDVVLREPLSSVSKFDTAELDSLIDEIQEGTKSLATTMGYTKFSDNYITHAMIDDATVAGEFSNIYKSLGLDKDKLDQLCNALKEQDIASGKLQFGAIPVERSHLGYFSQYKTKDGMYMFSTNLKDIHSNTFTKGMFDNINAQTYFDLFLTDNFKIKNNFDSVETLKEALNLSTGNLNNLAIVKPRYNESGKLIGFTRYDKFSEAALQKAFNDENVVLLPNEVFGSLDRICKKDARMSNKVYRFINKYLTVPFKFGTLANPGFLAGNIQDAYFKQAIELSKKYGTTLEDELANVAFSMRQITQLNNEFSEVFDNYRNWLKDTDLSTITQSTKPKGWYEKTFNKSKSLVDTLTIDQIVGNPEMYKAFKEYVNVHVPVEQRRMAHLYLYLNNNQTTTLFKNNNRDLEDLAELVNTNPYNTPNNMMERIMYGDPSKTKVVKINGKFREVQDKGFNSYGLFLNNPVSNGILKSSNTIENWMRSSTILNDLQHQGYTLEDICDILGTDKVTEKALRQKLNISMGEAINTMHAANFDYDNVGEFMNKVSYILPFPTFYLKNLAFWADIFTNKPQLVDNMISVHEELWSGKDTSKDEFTAEAKGRGAIPIGQQGNKHLTGIVKQTPYNSMFGAFNAVNNLKEDFAYRINPIMRPITRHLQDPNDIKYRPYNTQQFQKNIKQSDPQFSELSYMFHQLNPYERFINTGLRTPGKIANNTYQLSDFLPSMFQPDFSKKSKK